MKRFFMALVTLALIAACISLFAGGAKSGGDEPELRLRGIQCAAVEFLQHPERKKR